MSSGNRSILLALWVLGVVLIASAGFLWWSQQKDDRAINALGDARSVAMPELPEDVSPTYGYLTGDGAVLIAAVREISWDTDDDAIPDCVSTASALDTIGSPAHLRDVTLDVPDDVTGDIARAYIDTAISFITHCLAGENPDAADVQFASVVFERRLQELGV